MTMSQSAKQNATKPEIFIVDMTKKEHFKRSGFLSEKLLEEIRHTLEHGHQSLLFHNRRGTASTTLCKVCSWSAMCQTCFIPLTLHNDAFHLRCHMCGLKEKVPTSCPNCHGADIIHKGIGTKRIVDELIRLFPSAKVVRFDGDNSATESLDASYQELYDGKIDIIVGTQVIAKGLDLPHLRLVGVVQADSGLSLPDFQSAERVFQLLSQVVGRVGRNENPSKIVIQSFQPTHPSVCLGLAQDYKAFYEQEIATRAYAMYPPFSYLLKITCSFKSERTAIKNAQELARLLQDKASIDTEIIGPAPAFYERIRDTYRWQLTLKSSKRSDLARLTEFIPTKNWQYELDPTNLLS
ncbi:primosomal protein N' [Candidatus Saccharibacteria bacterium 32-45-3]|nr:MAG: primosomal protein N' [Candidatus Saccharibacteria bacterium 32-45-3]